MSSSLIVELCLSRHDTCVTSVSPVSLSDKSSALRCTLCVSPSHTDVHPDAVIPQSRSRSVCSLQSSLDTQSANMAACSSSSCMRPSVTMWGGPVGWTHTHLLHQCGPVPCSACMYRCWVLQWPEGCHWHLPVLIKPTPHSQCIQMVCCV